MLAIVGAVGYGIWHYLINPQPTETVQNNIRRSPEGPLKQLGGEDVFDYWINKNTGAIYYMATDGQIYKTTSSSTPEALSSKATGKLSYIKPSYDGSLILVGFGYPQVPTMAVYNPSTKSWLALPAGAVAATWDPKSNNRIAYLKDAGNSAQIYYFTLADKKSGLITSLSGKDLDLDWAFPDTLYLTQRPAAQVPGSVWSYNLKTGSVQTVAREESGLSIKWDGSGSDGLRWSFGQLSLIDKSNKTLSNIMLKTLPSKCVFTDIKIYCAAPENQSSTEAGALSDAYLKGTVNLNDNIYSAYLSIIKTSPTSYPLVENVSAGTNLDHLEILNDRLIFINRKDRKLYSLSL